MNTTCPKELQNLLETRCTFSFRYFCLLNHFHLFFPYFLFKFSDSSRAKHFIHSNIYCGSLLEHNAIYDVGRWEWKSSGRTIVKAFLEEGSYSMISFVCRWCDLSYFRHIAPLRNNTLREILCIYLIKKLSLKFSFGK